MFPVERQGRRGHSKPSPLTPGPIPSASQVVPEGFSPTLGLFHHPPLPRGGVTVPITQLCSWPKPGVLSWGPTRSGH